MSRNFWDMAISIICGIAAAGIYEAITRRLLPYLDKRKFKCVFGKDIFNDSEFHLVYALLHPALLFKEDTTDSFVKEVREKVSAGKVRVGIAKIRNGKSRPLHTTNPVSIGGVRAIKHISAAVEAKSGRATISSDFELEVKGEPDISFVSFGGEAGNDKTGEVFRDNGNELVVLDQPGEGKSPRFVSKTSGRTLLSPIKDYDYGLILKIRPSQYPERVWFVCAGFAESGTSGAAWYLANK